MDDETFTQHEADRGIDRELEEEHATEKRCSSCDATESDPTCFCLGPDDLADPFCEHCHGKAFCPAFPNDGPF